VCAPKLTGSQASLVYCA